MKIDVLHSDIEYGIKRNCEDCPIARAINRALNNPSRTVEVTHMTVYIGTETFRLPTVATEFIRTFDDEREVRPFSFEMEIA